MSDTALLTFSIGPVGSFIYQARRIADLWAGSDLLSHLTGQAVDSVRKSPGADVIFPYVEADKPVPRGITNRLVARVPAATATDIAKLAKTAVETEWGRLAGLAETRLRENEIEPSGKTAVQIDALLQISWSWVPERGGYAEASRAGAACSIAARKFRPFVQTAEEGDKCAICGERTALPDGEREPVRVAWKRAAALSKEKKRFFRFDQGSLCRVCSTKRFYPDLVGRDPRFTDFFRFRPFDDEPDADPKATDAAKTTAKDKKSKEKDRDREPYFALVALDGDRMGDALSLGAEHFLGEKSVEAFHRGLSKALGEFAASLRKGDHASLDLANLEGLELVGAEPQLLYAGGEDILLVCDPRDAIAVAQAIRRHFQKAIAPLEQLFKDPSSFAKLTISAAILIGHVKWPVGLLVRDVEDLLKRKAKKEAGRNAIAIRLAKRGGVPAEVAFKWEEKVCDSETTWLERMTQVMDHLRPKTVEGSTEDPRLASRTTFNLRLEEDTLFEVFGTCETRWQAWLADRLSRRETAGSDELATLLAPFFVHQKTEALRLARFLAREAS